MHSKPVKNFFNTSLEFWVTFWNKQIRRRKRIFKCKEKNFFFKKDGINDRLRESYYFNQPTFKEVTAFKNIVGPILKSSLA